MWLTIPISRYSEGEKIHYILGVKLIMEATTLTVPNKKTAKV